MTTVLGDVMALGCALVWAVAVTLFRRLRDVHPVALNLFKNAVAAALLLLTMAALGLRFDTHRTALDWLRLAGSGVLGRAVADSLVLAGLRGVDGSVAAVADTAYAPTVIALSTLFLHETPRAGMRWGAPMVIAGLLLVAWRRAGQRVVDPRSLALVVGGVMTTAVGVVLAKPALGRSHLVEATTVRLLAGSAALMLAQVVTGRTREALALFTPQPAWRVAVPATVLATYLSMLLWLGGMKYGTASRAALLNQSGAVALLVLSWRAGEAVSPRRWLGAALAIAGVAVVLTR
jgi:drug/metabolite transporter (DMT)-like permease